MSQKAATICCFYQLKKSLNIMQKREEYKVSVPGSLMLLGEHAVLHGKMALVCAINKRIYVTLRQRQDRSVYIKSDLLGEITISLDKLSIVAPFQFVLSAVIMLKKRLHHGFDLLITTDFSAQMGFGSSAAVTVATLAVLHYWLEQRQPQAHKLFLEARRVIRKVQGIGSGADAAASIWGGVVAYRAAPLQVKKIADTLPLTVVYSGQKVGTKQVVQQVMKLRQQHKKSIRILEMAIENCVKDAAIVIRKQDWRKLGEIININQGIQDAFGVNTLTLSQAVFALRSMRGICGAKISGAGMGDCVIGIGKAKKISFDEVVSKIKATDLSMINDVVIAKMGLRVQ